jgi:hypothetical protein
MSVRHELHIVHQRPILVPLTEQEFKRRCLSDEKAVLKEQIGQLQTMGPRYVYIYIYLYTYTYTHTYTQIHIHTHINTYIHTHIHTYTYIYTYTNTYTRYLIKLEHVQEEFLRVTDKMFKCI